MRQITITAPVQYSDFTSQPTGLLISLVVGIAAGEATADDVGRREMIGLAATAQIAIVPTWFGLCIVLGFRAADSTPPSHRILGLLINIAAIVVASLGTYAAMRLKGSSLNFFKADPARESFSATGLKRTTAQTGIHD